MPEAGSRACLEVDYPATPYLVRIRLAIRRLLTTTSVVRWPFTCSVMRPMISPICSADGHAPQLVVRELEGQVERSLCPTSRIAGEPSGFGFSKSCSGRPALSRLSGPYAVRVRTAFYVAIALILIVFGYLALFSIGWPFVLTGLLMLALIGERRRPNVLAPALAWPWAFTLGYVLVAPLGCTSSAMPIIAGDAGSVEESTRCNAVFFTYLGGADYSHLCCQLCSPASRSRQRHPSRSDGRFDAGWEPIDAPSIGASDCRDARWNIAYPTSNGHQQFNRRRLPLQPLFPIHLGGHVVAMTNATHCDTPPVRVSRLSLARSPSSAAMTTASSRDSVRDGRSQLLLDQGKGDGLGDGSGLGDGLGAGDGHHFGWFWLSDGLADRRAQRSTRGRPGRTLAASSVG